MMHPIAKLLTLLAWFSFILSGPAFVTSLILSGFPQVFAFASFALVASAIFVIQQPTRQPTRQPTHQPTRQPSQTRIDTEEKALFLYAFFVLIIALSLHTNHLRSLF